MVCAAVNIIAILLIAAVLGPPPLVDGTGPPTPEATPLAVPPKPTGWGTHQTGFHNYTIPRLGQPDVAARLQYPATSSGMDSPVDAAGGPWPVVIYYPGGFGGSYTVATSRLIASWGFVVLDVELTNTYGAGCCRDPLLMASEVPLVVDFLEDLNTNGSMQYVGLLDLDKLGVTGHSWGGLAAALSVTDRYGDDRIHYAAPISATPAVALDYTEDVIEPMYYLTGSAGDNNLQPLYDATPSPAAYIVVTGVDHGGMVGQTAYVVAFFLYWMAGQIDYEWWIYTQGIHDEDDAGTVTYQSKLCMPRVEVDPVQVEEDSSVDFRGWSEGLTWGAVSYEWDVDGVAGYDTNDSTPNVTHSHTFTSMALPTAKLRVTHQWETVVVVVQLNITNVAPIPVAGADQTTTEDAVVHVDASNSSDTPSDEIAGLSYAWDFGDGSIRSFDLDPTFAHVYVAAGVYIVTLSVRDDDGNVTTDNLAVEVSEGIPFVDAGADFVGAMDGPVEFDGSAVDTPTDTAAGFSYTWDFGDGSDPSGESPLGSAEHTYTSPGTFVAMLTATDLDGASGSGIVNVTILNGEPIASILEPLDGTKVLKDQPLTFDGRGVDSLTDLASLEFAWDFGAGAALTFGPSPLSSHTYRTSGPASATFWTRDPHGATSSATVNITVLNEAPTILSIEPSKSVAIDEDSSLHLEVEADDTVSDLSGLTYTWSVGGVVVSTLPVDDIAFSEYVKGELTLVVADPEGAATSSKVPLLVRNPAPEITIAHPMREAKVGTSVPYEANATDTPSDQGILTIVWDFDDGTNATGAVVNHTFSEPGTYEVSVQATDDEGASSSLSVRIKVTAAPTTGKPKDPQGPKDNSTDNPAALTMSTPILLGLSGLVLVAALLVLLAVRRRRPPQPNAPMEPTAVSPSAAIPPSTGPLEPLPEAPLPVTSPQAPFPSPSAPAPSLPAAGQSPQASAQTQTEEIAW